MVMLFGQSLPVAFGEETAKWICVGAIDITQISVAGTSFLSISNIYLSLKKIFFFLKIYFFKQILFVADVISQWIDVTGYLLGAGKPYYALALLALIIPQVIFQVKHLQRFFTVEVKVQHRIFSVSFYCSWVFVWLYLGVKLSYNSLGFIP